MKSLQNRIFLFFVVLLLIVQSVALWTILSGKQNQETLEIQSRLATANTLFNELFNSRTHYLKAFSDTAAHDYGIKQIFNQDTRSLVVALNNLRQRIDADMAMTIDSNGRINSQLVKTMTGGVGKVRKGSQSEALFSYSHWLDPNNPPTELYKVADNLYQLSLSPIMVGSTLLGWIGFGYQIDHRLAMRYHKLTGLHTSFILQEQPRQQWQLVASSSLGTELDFVRDIIEGKPLPHYISQSQILSSYDDFNFGVAMYSLRADLVEVLQEQWWQLLALIILTLVLSLGGAYAIAASITKPIKQLVKQTQKLASGEYQQLLPIKDQSELGQLAEEFNTMQSAILSRERAIEHKANHHPLTDLPNRNMLLSLLEQLTAETESFAVFHLNLSRLKDVNDTLGH